MAETDRESVGTGSLRFVAKRGTVLVGEAISRFAAFLGFPLAALYLSDPELGRLAIAMLVFSLMTILFDLGITTAATKIHFDAPNDGGGAGDLWWLILSLEGAVLAVAVLFGPFLASAAFQDVSFFPLLLVVTFGAAGGGLAAFAQARYRATFQFERLAGLTATRAMLVTVPGILGAALTNTALGYIGGIAIGQAVLGLVTLALFRHEIRRPGTALWYPALKFGVPLVPYLLFGWWLALADRMLLERWRGIAAVGIYALAYQLAFASSALMVGLNSIWGPQVYRWYSQNSVEETDRILAKATLPAIAVFVLAAAIAVSLAPMVFRVVRPDTRVPASIFAVVALASLFFGLYLFSATPVLARGATRMLPIATGVGVVVNLGGNIALIPPHGALGAAIATLLGFAATATTITALGRSIGFTPVLARQLARGLLILVALSAAVLTIPVPVNVGVLWLAGILGVSASTVRVRRQIALSRLN